MSDVPIGTVRDLDVDLVADGVHDDSKCPVIAQELHTARDAVKERDAAVATMRNELIKLSGLVANGDYGEENIRIVSEGMKEIAGNPDDGEPSTAILLELSTWKRRATQAIDILHQVYADLETAGCREITEETAKMITTLCERTD